MCCFFKGISGQKAEEGGGGAGGLVGKLEGGGDFFFFLESMTDTVLRPVQSSLLKQHRGFRCVLTRLCFICHADRPSHCEYAAPRRLVAFRQPICRRAPVARRFTFSNLHAVAD